MKYKAIIETDDYKDFKFFEDGNGKYIRGIDDGAVNNEWLALYFTECGQEPILDKIRADVEQLPITDTAIRLVTEILDKNKTESEPQESEEQDEDADGKIFEDDCKQGYEQHGKDFILDGERIREDALKEVMTQGYAISLLRESGWLNKYGEECIREAILNRHLMTPEEAEDEFNFEQGKLEGRLEVLASIKDLCNSLESEEQA